MLGVMGIDQWGETYHNLGSHPRSELLCRLNRARAEKMYIDGEDGKAVHVGYIIGGRWIRLYTVGDWTGKARGATAAGVTTGARHAEREYGLRA